MTVAGGGALICVVHHDLHLQVERLTVDGVLGRVVESDLQHLPDQLDRAGEGLSRVEVPHVAFCCVDTVHIIFNEVVGFCNGGDRPSA